MAQPHQQRLSRLEPEYYRNEAWVHWTVTIEDRKQGWLDARFYYKLREILTHVAFRNQLACPIFTLMPDHMHLLWCGLSEATDQLIAMKHFRKDINECLKAIGYQLQLQSYDHVLQNEELDQHAVENTIEYIARNPERKGLIARDEFGTYRYSGCLIPGYPQFRLFADEGWDRMWRTLSFLKRTQCFRIPDSKYIKDPPIP